MTRPTQSQDRKQNDDIESFITDRHALLWRTDRERLRQYASESGLQQFMTRMQSVHDTESGTSSHAVTIPDPRDSTQLGIQSTSRSNAIGALGPYVLLRQVGCGGMGVVYEACDSRIDRHVAIKIQLGWEDSAQSRERLAREARSLAKLSHPNILQIYDINETAVGLPYLVTEFASGGTLREQLRAGPLSAHLAGEIAACIARGLTLAHHAGIVHRDIKPSNILIQLERAPSAEGEASAEPIHGTLSSRGWIPKLADFGLARPMDESMRLTQSSVIAGTPAYMSPEQICDSNRVQSSTDIYSLGVTLYEMLTGEVPFRGSSQAVLHQVLEGEFIPPRRLNRSIPEALETICLHAMEFDADKRYLTAQSLADDLDRFLRGEPILAKPISKWQRIQRWCGRHKATALLLAIIATLTLVGTAGGIAGVLSLRSAYQDAIQAQERLERAVKESDDAFALTQDTLQTIVVRVRDDLYQVPQATKLVVQTSQDSANLHRRLLAIRPNDLRSAKALADALNHLANAEWVLGNRDESRAATDELEEVLKQATHRHPDDFDLESAWCKLIIDRVTFPSPNATLQTQANYEAVMRESMAAMQSKYPNHPAVAKLAMIEAKCHATLARKAGDDQRLNEANQLAEQAAARYEELASPNEAEEAKLWHAQTMRVVADYYSQREQWDDALAWYARAIACIEANPLVDTEREARYQAAKLSSSYGRALLKMNRAQEAASILDKSVARFETLVKDFPEDVPYGRERLAVLLARCLCRLSLDDRTAAAMDMAQATEGLQSLPKEALSSSEREKFQLEIDALRGRLEN